MVRYKKADKGKKYVLTEFGLEQSHVRAKYHNDHPLVKQYRHSAPVVWIEKGYVQEVDDT